MTNALPAVVRTLVPLLVALFTSWGAQRIGLTDEALTNLATALVAAVYYVAVFLLERYVPQAGWLLGVARRPSYDNGKVIPGDLAK